MSRPRIHGFRTYDDWKLATPPEYDELGPEPRDCEEPEPEEQGGFVDLRSRENWKDGKCKRCGLARTPKGHDPCIANLPGVVFACCGHGENQAYVVFENGVCIRGHF